MDNQTTKAYICKECSNTISAHVFCRPADKSWSQEQLAEWENFQNKEKDEAKSYFLKTRSGLVNLIDGLRRIEEKVAESPETGYAEVYIKKYLRAEVKEAVKKLLDLI